MRAAIDQPDDGDIEDEAEPDPAAVLAENVVTLIGLMTEIAAACDRLGERMDSLEALFQSWRHVGGY